MGDRLRNPNPSSTRKKRKTTTRGKVELFESFRGQKIVDTAESHIFSGITFCSS